MNETPRKNADLPVRVASAVVMVAVAGAALWLGGWGWALFVSAVGLGVLWEWWGLVRRFAPNGLSLLRWLTLGVIYIGGAVAFLIALRVMPGPGKLIVLPIVLSVISTDIGAYFAGRTFGGPKIAPKISPSKTWSGLLGGMLGAGTAFLLTVGGDCSRLDGSGVLPTLQECLTDSFKTGDAWHLLAIGALLAVVAQGGDFFESWMKRRAGVKDSGSLIPGHGGLFDRVDGLMAVCFATGLVSLVPYLLPYLGIL